VNTAPELFDRAPVGGDVPRRPRPHVPHVEIAFGVAAHDVVGFPRDACDGGCWGMEGFILRLIGVSGRKKVKKGSINNLSQKAAG
jgi:hypothetical protein